MYILTKKDEVLVIDGNTYQTVKTIQPESIIQPFWMVVDSKDNFFLVSSSTSEIFKYDTDFKRILQFGGHGESKGSLNSVGRIFVGPKDNIYVMNTYNPNSMEIKIYDNNGKFLSSWPVTKVKMFDALTSMAIAADGDVYINSYSENRIYVFSSNGKFLGSFDSDKDGKFQIFNGVTLASGGKNGLLYLFSSKIGVLKTIDY